MRLLWLIFLCFSTPSWGQSLELDGVQLIVRADLQVQPYVAGVATVALIGNMAIVPKLSGTQSLQGTASAHYLAVAQDAVSGQYGLISNEISFKVKSGAVGPTLPAGLRVKPLVGKNIFLVRVESLQVLQTVVLILRTSPQIEWIQTSFISDVSRPQ
jgi:hypothetical protein